MICTEERPFVPPFGFYQSPKQSHTLLTAYSAPGKIWCWPSGDYIEQIINHVSLKQYLWHESKFLYFSFALNKLQTRTNYFCTHLTFFSPMHLEASREKQVSQTLFQGIHFFCTFTMVCFSFFSLAILNRVHLTLNCSNCISG